MRLSFLGATGSVTGAKYLLEHEGRRLLVDPATIGLGVDAAAGDEEQAPGFLPVQFEPGQNMGQAVDVGLAIAGFVGLAGRRAIHQVLQRPLGPLRGAFGPVQISS